MLIRFYYVNLKTKVSLDLKERQKKKIQKKSNRKKSLYTVKNKTKNVSSKTSNKL